MSDQKRITILAALVLLCLVWGSTWLGIKIQIRDQPPLGAAALRFLLAAVLIAATAGRRRIPAGENPGLRFWVLLSIVNIALPYGLVYWAEQYIPSGVAAVLFATYPLFVGLLAHRLAGEHLGAALLVGVALGCAGIAVMFSGDLLAFHPRFIPGGIAVLGSAVAAAIATVLVKRRLAHLDPLLINLRPMLFGGLMLLLASLVLESGATWSWTPGGIAALLYLSVFGSVVAFGVYFWLMRVVPISRLSFFTYVTPIVALVLGIWIEDEPFTPRLAAGIGLVMAAVLLVRRSAPAPLTERPDTARLGASTER